MYYTKGVKWPSVTVVNYGSGNVASVANALSSMGRNVVVTESVFEIEQASLLVLPGVGSYAGFLQSLKSRGLIEVLLNCFARDIPLLGICVGMQAFGLSSEENEDESGLGVVSGRVVSLTDITRGKVPVPQLGWNEVRVHGSVESGSPIWGVDGRDMYFMHSYAFPPAQDACQALTTYGEDFTSVIKTGRWTGVQFHPEKSGKAGLDFLDSWIRSES